MNSWTFSKVYNQFLTFISSCSFADLTDEELTKELENFLLRALADFRFPQCDLEYEAIENDYVFTDEKFGQREVNVILAYMNKYFLQWILSREKNFEQQYYDADTKTHSLGNLVQQMNNAYKIAIKEANDINYDYARMDRKRKPRIGSVNV